MLKRYNIVNNSIKRDVMTNKIKNNLKINQSLKKIKVKFCVIILCIATILFAMLLGCSNKTIKQESNFYSFIDSIGQMVTLSKKPERVISVYGSYAELWLLSGGDLVGATDDAIEERNLNLSKDVSIIGSVKNPSLDKIIMLNADFIILSSDIDSHLMLKSNLKELKISYAYFSQDNVDDYLKYLKICTDINDRADLFINYGENLKYKIQEIIDYSNSINISKSVLLLRAMSTKVKALDSNNITGTILHDLNCINIADTNAVLTSDLSLDIILKSNPQVIFILTMGDVDTAIKTFENSIVKNTAWQSLSAIKNKKYYILDKELFHYKPNNRFIDSYQTIKDILYENN